jgi:ABC-2 type transport system ATP-binding protein
VPVLEARDVSLRYPASRGAPGALALDGVGLVVGPGEAVALLGPNGSGKSSLLKIICGMLSPSAGAVELFGLPQGPAARARLGAVFQRTALDPYLTIRENLRLQARLYGLSRSDATRRIAAQLEETGLIDRADQRVRTLSGGLARRADLCRALLHEPALLVLDEPTTGLDPAAREGFLDQLDRWRRERGLTVVMSTHLVDEAERLERVVLLAGGRVIADETPAELRREVGRHAITVHDPGWQPDMARGEWERIAGGWRAYRADDAERTTALVTDLARSGVPFSVAPPTLSDVFEHLSGAALEPAAGEDA